MGYIIRVVRKGANETHLGVLLAAGLDYCLYVIQCMDALLCIQAFFFWVP
jgi:hypothetical protein